MKNILIDTNAYASFKRGKNEAIEIIQRVSIIGINSVVLGELLAGFAGGNRNDFSLGIIPMWAIRLSTPARRLRKVI